MSEGDDWSTMLIRNSKGEHVKLSEWEKETSLVDRLAYFGEMHRDFTRALNELRRKRDQLAEEFQAATFAVSKQERDLVEIRRRLLLAASESR